MTGTAIDALGEALCSAVEKALAPLTARLEDFEAQQGQILKAIQDVGRQRKGPSADLTDLYTLQQAAECLKVDKKTIWRWTRDGSLPSVRIRGVVRIRGMDLRQMVNRGLQTCASDPR